MTSITRLRRRPVSVTDPADNIVLAAVVLRCCRCSTTWQARLGPHGDDVADGETRCPSCNPEPPRAA